MLLHCFGNSHVWSLIGSFGLSDQRIESSDGDLRTVGWKLGGSGATAWALPDHGTTSGAGDKIVGILDSIPGKKDVLMVFGEVDVTEHIGKHGEDITASIDHAVARYASYLTMIEKRDDTGLVLVASTVPHSHRFRPIEHELLKSISRQWNAALEAACEPLNLTYVDWYDCVDSAFGSPLDGEVEDCGERNPGDPEERHMSDAVRPILLSAVRSALLRYEE
jgi:hypothetical protein